MLDHYKEYGVLSTLNIVWPMNMFGLIAFLCILKLPFHSQLTYFFKKGICWLWKKKTTEKNIGLPTFKLPAQVRKINYDWPVKY